MRLVAFAIALAIARPAFAERRVNSLANTICVYVLGTTNENRVELAPFAGTSLDGGVYRQDSYGGAMRYALSDEWVAIAEARKLGASARVVLPVAVTTERRTAAASMELGYSPFYGKLVIARDTILSFDVIASLGPGIVARADPQDRDTSGIAISGGVALRVFVTPWLTLEFGLHDDYVPWDPVPATAPRTIDGHAIDPAKHDIEVRAGFGGWLPAKPYRRCRHRCY